VASGLQTELKWKCQTRFLVAREFEKSSGKGRHIMAKPDVTLQPSKGVVTQAAADIFAAYIAAGHVNGQSDEWIKRAIREAIIIARTVDTTVQSDEELPATGEDNLRESSIDAELPSDPADDELLAPE
jgi:hypothetical protein